MQKKTVKQGGSLTGQGEHDEVGLVLPSALPGAQAGMRTGVELFHQLQLIQGNRGHADTVITQEIYTT